MALSEECRRFGLGCSLIFVTAFLFQTYVVVESMICGVTARDFFRTEVTDNDADYMWYAATAKTKRQTHTIAE